jgi:excisionase family DNA binding protein
MTKKLYRVPEVADMLSVSSKLIWKMVAMRELEVVRLGRAVRISAHSVDDCLARGTTPAISDSPSPRVNRQGSGSRTRSAGPVAIERDRTA